MEIRSYKNEDINNINKLGSLLHSNYKFDIDLFSNANIILENDSFIGFIVYSVMYERAEIIDIIINPKYRNNSYGSKLLEYTISKIRDKNCENITLEVNKNNLSAIGLYKKYGFEICAIRENYYTGEDGYLMKKDLR